MTEPDEMHPLRSLGDRGQDYGTREVARSTVPEGDDPERTGPQRSRYHPRSVTDAGVRVGIDAVVANNPQTAPTTSGQIAANARRYQRYVMTWNVRHFQESGVDTVNPWEV